MRLTDGSSRARLILALDLFALVVFVAVGIGSHATLSRAEAFFRNAVPIVAAWLVAAALLRTYRPPSVRGLLKTWIVAMPVGILVRSLWVGSPTGGRLLVFLGVALAFTLLFLAFARGVAFLVRRRRWLR